MSEVNLTYAEALLREAVEDWAAAGEIARKYVDRVDAIREDLRRVIDDDPDDPDIAECLRDDLAIERNRARYLAERTAACFSEFTELASSGLSK